MGLTAGPYMYFSWLLFFFFLTLHTISKSCGRSSTYIIHIDKSFKPIAFNTSKSWHLSTLHSLQAINASPSPSLVYSYENAAYGFSALLSLGELNVLKKHPGFIHAYRDKTAATMDTTHALKFLKLDSPFGLWPTSRYGDDVIVGVIDSGIWPENPSFKSDGMTRIPTRWKGRCTNGQHFDTSMCNSKLIGARYFKNGLLAAKPGIKLTMDSARDTTGHGTSTSSIIVGNFVHHASYFGYANGIAKGVAPRARVAMYKVHWEEGQYSSDVLAGMDKAIADGVDVICITLGYDGAPLYDDPVAVASFAAMEKGILVVASAGNKGPSLGKLHNGIPWVLTVGAGTMDRSFAGTLTLGDGQTIIGWTLFPASAIVQNVPIIYNKTISACNSAELLSQAPYGIILCDRTRNVLDQIHFITSSSNIVAAIFISDDPKLLENGGMTCSGVVVSPKDAPIIIAYATRSYSPLGSIEFQQTILDVKPAPAAAYYSSRGPSPSYPGILKPDVIAPGSLVLTSWIRSIKAAQIGPNVALSSDFKLVSGTSVACPIVSGVAALLKGAHPTWSAAAIRSAMMTTANPLDNTFYAIKDNGMYSKPATPLAIGAGQIDPNRALEPGLIYDATPQDYVNLLCTTGYTPNQIRAITNSNVYTCSNPTAQLNYPSFIAFYKPETSSLITRVFRRTVTNVGAGPAIYNALVISPRGTLARVTPETLVFNNRHERQSYSLAIQYRGNNLQTVSFGELVWNDTSGKYKVRSPIVISRYM